MHGDYLLRESNMRAIPESGKGIDMDQSQSLETAPRRPVAAGTQDALKVAGCGVF
jgi:hypothetical protein